jgi:hypothetical protein
MIPGQRQPPRRMSTPGSAPPPATDEQVTASAPATEPAIASARSRNPDRGAVAIRQNGSSCARRSR